MLLIGIRLEFAEYLVNLLIDLLAGRYDLLTQLFHRPEASLGPLEDLVGDESVGTAHELFILAHLLVEQLRKDGLADTTGSTSRLVGCILCF